MLKNFIDPVKKFIDSKYHPKEKDFYQKGYLTPQQFVEAGNQLTNCGWKWEKSIKQAKLNKNLPQNYQFLSSKAHSEKRIKQVMSLEISQTLVDNYFVNYQNIQTVGQELSIQVNENIRTYRLGISYDQYYHCPRLWISGNDIKGKPLSKDQIFEDIMSNYQNETVTEQINPLLNIRQVTIHPCKHSDVFKEFIDKAKQDGKTIKSKQALFLFLKFMSSVMPTVKYDFTVDIQI